MMEFLKFVLALLGSFAGLFAVICIGAWIDSKDPDSAYSREQRRLAYQRQVNRAKRRDHLEHELLTGPFTGHRWDCPQCSRQRDSLAA